MENVMKNQEIVSTTVKDPVCGMTIASDSASGSSVYGGKTWHFCSPGCKGKFEAAPGKYAGSAGEKKKEADSPNGSAPKKQGALYTGMPRVVALSAACRWKRKP
jgi:YHS domain-containing protein